MLNAVNKKLRFLLGLLLVTRVIQLPTATITGYAQMLPLPAKQVVHASPIMQEYIVNFVMLLIQPTRFVTNQFVRRPRTAAIMENVLLFKFLVALHFVPTLKHVMHGMVIQLVRTPLKLLAFLLVQWLVVPQVETLFTSEPDQPTEVNQAPVSLRALHLVPARQLCRSHATITLFVAQRLPQLSAPQEYPDLEIVAWLRSHVAMVSAAQVPKHVRFTRYLRQLLGQLQAVAARIQVSQLRLSSGW